MNIPNVLADRYASKEMISIFDSTERIILERRFWLSVMKAQSELGLDIPFDAIKAYESIITDVDLGSIRERELKLKHDIPAKLHEFNELAGYEHAHKGLTSRDLTENVDQIQIYLAATLIYERCLALLKLFGEKAEEYSDIIIVARTHNVPAQPTTLGKRFAQLSEELLLALDGLKFFISNFKLRGIRGPVGTRKDQIDLLGSEEFANELEKKVLDQFGLKSTFSSVGQVYPRSYDFQLAAVLLQLGAAPSNLALMVRLMSGIELASEGFGEGQVGSSAMPHKMNSRSAERINGLYKVLEGYQLMCAQISGDQWYEGDVSCSVVRRVAIPNLFFSLDGIFETTFAVLNGMVVFEEMIAKELDRYLPFVSTTALLMNAVKSGKSREQAHEIIKKYAVETVLEMRKGQGDGMDLVKKLADDAEFPGSLEELTGVINNSELMLGDSKSQISSVIRKIDDSIAEYGKQVNYKGSEII